MAITHMAFADTIFFLLQLWGLCDIDIDISNTYLLTGNSDSSLTAHLNILTRKLVYFEPHQYFCFTTKVIILDNH